MREGKERRGEERERKATKDVKQIMAWMVDEKCMYLEMSRFDIESLEISPRGVFLPTDIKQNKPMCTRTCECDVTWS